MMGLSVEHISHDWGKKRALDDVSFHVAYGEFCALLGPNGAGKSTLFALLTGLVSPRQGRIEIAGSDIATAPRAALSRMGVVFQQQTLDLDLTVWRNMLYFAGLHGIVGKAARVASQEALERLGMVERAKERARDLNGGHRRRLEIARALMHQPEVLLLDEPTVGLDAASRKSLTDHVHSLAQDTKLSVLWATHLTDEVYAGDRLVVLHRGAVLENGYAQETSSDLTDRFLSLTGEAA
ncbi:ABC transporter ATP-binding protein [Celeribacter litoreus]|uniref:ABC transporter ATP-binding protein n=1 Tax=Celeribacter litoreus TaxID=2876714 RepID=UPI001CCF0224|nr:ABC transporter ATP-binding protein [Celeribacter litoreus]MCA0044439.1 ATP-binding cassette domain-containing protein [Celeribacter litoreus]